jgi:hypothetical protein
VLPQFAPWLSDEPESPSAPPFEPESALELPSEPELALPSEPSASEPELLPESPLFPPAESDLPFEPLLPFEPDAVFPPELLFSEPDVVFPPEALLLSELAAALPVESEEGEELETEPVELPLPPPEEEVLEATLSRPLPPLFFFILRSASFFAIKDSCLVFSL